jgi:hypothetical protein
MAITTTSMPGVTTRRASRATLKPNTVGLLIAVALAPLVALVASSSELRTAGIVAAGLLLLLVALWSVEATFYVLILSMLLSPEFIVGQLGGPSAATASRGITLRLDDYIILIISLAWLIRLAVYKEASFLRRTSLNGPIFAYIGFATIATLWGGMMGRLNLLTGVFFVLKYLEYTFIYFLAINYIRDRAQVRRLLIAVLATAVIISIIGLAQIPSGQRISAPFEGEEGEPNTLGGYLVFVMGLALAYLGETRRMTQRLVWLGAVAIMTVPLAFTYSRTSWLAFAVMLTATIALSRNRAIFLLLISIGLVVLVISPPQALVERASYTLSAQGDSMTVFGYSIEPSAAARLEAWNIAAGVVGKHPFAGAGVTGAGLIDAQYPRTLAETGLVGFALFCWLLWRIGASAFRLRRQATTTTETVLAAGFLAGFAGILVHGVGANTFIIVRIMEPMWMIVGLIGASLLIHRDENQPTPGDRPGPRSAA